MPDQRLTWVSEDLAVLRELARRDPTVPIPSCPGWSMATLIGHVANVFDGWWTYTLRSSAEEEVDVRQFIAQHTTAVAKDPGELVEFFADAAGTWLAEAQRTDPAKPTWTFKGPGRADFWFGRASTECAVHRWDAEAAFADAPTVAAERASDGITETLDALLRPRTGLPLPVVPMRVVPDD